MNVPVWFSMPLLFVALVLQPGCSGDDDATAKNDRQPSATSTGGDDDTSAINSSADPVTTDAPPPSDEGHAQQQVTATTPSENSEASPTLTPPPAEKLEPIEPPTTAQVMALLDLRSDLKRLPGASGGQTTMTDDYYTARGTMDEALQFYATQLNDAGWQADEKMNVDSRNAKMRFFRKEGFLLMATTNPGDETDQVTLSITNLGNIRCAALPHPEGAKLVSETMHSASYSIKPKQLVAAVGGKDDLKPIDAAMQFVRTELPKQGWTEFKMNYPSDSFGGPKILFFMQRASMLTVYIRSGWSSFSIDYQGTLLNRGLTVIGNASDVTLDDDYGILKFTTDVAAADVVEHHRTSLAKLGWIVMPGGEDTSDVGVQLVLSDGSEEYYNIIALKRADGGADVHISKIDAMDAKELIGKLQSE